MSEQQTIQAPYVLRWARYGFGAYLIGYGVAAWVSPRSRLPVNAVVDIGDVISLPPHDLIAVMFLVPGMLLLGPRTRSLGLWLALVSMCIFEVGHIISAAEGTGTYTAPVTFGFASVWAALLVSLRNVRGEPWPIR